MVESCSSEAILMFDGGDVVKVMTYAEFQALLDNYIPSHDLAKRDMQAVYLRLDPALQVTGAVFFRIAFDDQGFVDSDWNIPLQQLADNAAKGPDMGAGPIALACYSQCPIDWHRQSLWDPEREASHNDFHQIKKSIKNNKLGVFVQPQNNKGGSTGDSAGNSTVDSDKQGLDLAADIDVGGERTRTATLIKEQRLKHKLLLARVEQDKRQLSLDHQERILAYQQQLNDYQQQLSEQMALNVSLQEKVSGQADKIEGMREYFEAKLQAAENTDEDKVQALRGHYQGELLRQVEAAIAPYKAELKSREVELLYRAERETKLQQEILALQKERQNLMGFSGEDMLQRLSLAGVNLVVYHSGAGHLTLPAGEVNQYLQNPNAYAAARCGVNEHLYSTWLAHFRSPSCQHLLDNGEVCGAPVERVDDPSQFILGESDRCCHHRSHIPAVINISKNGHHNPSYLANRP